MARSGYLASNRRFFRVPWLQKISRNCLRFLRHIWRFWPLKNCNFSMIFVNLSPILAILTISLFCRSCINHSRGLPRVFYFGSVKISWNQKLPRLHFWLLLNSAARRCWALPGAASQNIKVLGNFYEFHFLLNCNNIFVNKMMTFLS